MAALGRVGTTLAAGANPARRRLRAFLSSGISREADGKFVDEPTHTGQVWDKDDYRRVRFIDKEKLINRNFAIDLIAEDPVVVVNAKCIWSDSGGALGHPKVYINLDKPEIAVCGYSGRKFIQKKFYSPSEHGPSITYEDYLLQVQPRK